MSVSQIYRTVPRYRVRSTNFRPGPRHCVFDEASDVVLRSFVRRDEAVAFLESLDVPASEELAMIDG